VICLPIFLCKYTTPDAILQQDKIGPDGMCCLQLRLRKVICLPIVAAIYCPQQQL
jgi:hypothetical protein